jgi:hypothetical protein
MHHRLRCWWDASPCPRYAPTAGWQALFERFPNRFLLGSDTWINERWAS